MSEFAEKRNTPPNDGTYGAALERLITDCEAQGHANREDRALILGLAARVSAEKRARYLARLADLEPPVDARGGPTYQKIVHLIDKLPRLKWTNAELQSELRAHGVDASAKEVGNIAAYLVRAGRFHRLARGVYRDARGNVVVTSEPLPTDDITVGGENED